MTTRRKFWTAIWGMGILALAAAATDQMNIVGVLCFALAVVNLFGFAYYVQHG